MRQIDSIWLTDWVKFTVLLEDPPTGEWYAVWMGEGPADLLRALNYARKKVLDGSDATRASILIERMVR
jgi:hypothetical protein